MARGKNEVTLTITGDADKLDRATKQGAQSVEKMTDSVRASSQDLDRFRQRSAEAAEGLGKVGDRFDESERRALGFRDGITGVQDSMTGVAALAKGDFAGGLLFAGQGVADLSSTVSNTLVPSLRSAVATMGLARLAAMGLAVGAVAGGAALLVMALNANDVEADVDGLRKSLDVMARSGRATGELRRIFGENTAAAGEFRTMLEQAAEMNERLSSGPTWMRGWTIGLADTFGLGLGSQAEALQNMGALDEAMAGMVTSGMDAGTAMDTLRNYMGGANYEFAVANDLLPRFEQVAGDATEGGLALAGSAEVTAEEWKVARQELATYMNMLRAQTDPLFGVMDAQDRYTESVEKTDEARQRYGLGSDEYRQALEDQTRAHLDLTSAEARVAEVNETELLPSLQEMQRQGRLTAEEYAVMANALRDYASVWQGVENLRTGAVAASGFGAGRGGGGSFGYGGGFGPGDVPGSFGEWLREQGGGTFHSGGVVGAGSGMAIGTEVPILAQVGEVVSPIGGGGGGGGGRFTMEYRGGGGGALAAVVDAVAQGMVIIDPQSGRQMALMAR